MHVEKRRGQDIDKHCELIAKHPQSQFYQHGRRQKTPTRAMQYLGGNACGSLYNDCTSVLNYQVQ
jgi:hypothetical protein